MDRMEILKNPNEPPKYYPVKAPRPKMPGTFKTVGDLIIELSKLDPDMPALLHTSFQLGEIFREGYTPYNAIGTEQVIRTSESNDWYERSNSPQAYEVAIIFNF